MRNPRLSIGLPVFNGEKYIKDALESILTQSYTDFELIISDNASTDRTPHICLEYAAKDKRIKFYQNNINRGAAWNFNYVFNLSKGEYFKWVAHDDLLAPEYLSKCIKVLDDDPSIVLCHTLTSSIDKNGRLIVLNVFNAKLRVDSLKPYVRFGDIIDMRYPSQLLLLGVIRSSALKKAGPHGEYHSADRNLLSELSLFGRIYEIPEYLFFWRDHPETYTRKKFSNNRERTFWLTGHTGGIICLPYWKICFEYFRSIKKTPIDGSQKLLCYAQIGRWFLTYGLFRMVEDIVNQIGNILLFTFASLR